MPEGFAVTNQRVLAALIAHPLRAHHGAEIRIEPRSWRARASVAACPAGESA